MPRILLLLLVFLWPAQALALAGDWVRDDAVGVRLVSGNEAVGKDGALSLGLDVQLAEGWHTYWRSPGEAGLPPQIDWGRSLTDNGNLKSSTFLYPAPTRYSAYGLETVGYRDHVLFPIDAVAANPGQPVHLDAGVDLLVCSSICVPKHFDVKLDIPMSASPAPGPEAALIKQFRDRVPTDPGSAGLLLQSIANDGQSLTFAVTSRDALTQPDIFIEDGDNIGFGAPKITIDATGHTATLRVKPVDSLQPGVSLAGMKLTLTLVNDRAATELKTTAPPVSGTPPSPAPQPLPLRLALWFALIGGLILNLMPCVLPVLSLKILSVASHGGGSARAVRQSFIVTAAGIVFSFLVLASATALAKNLGMAMGWGVQFQHPAFLLVLILLLTFFAANLWGLFDIPLPRFLADTLSKSYHPKLAGDFLTGAFATLLATPCSAPFLGTAVGFALASGTGDIFAIFAALGCGMALPYFAVALLPRAATLLPKPGPWMQYLRQMLGVALAATALWLTWVLAAQITAAYATTVGLFLAAVIILLALRKRGVKRGLVLAGLIEICAVIVLLMYSGALLPKPVPQMERKWLAWSPNALAADIAEGKTVFLDVTADWCLTCKANMKFVLTQDEVAHRLFHGTLIAMQADWTNPDPAITDLLHTYGRYGIPFNAVFGPGAPQGIVLPELLTKKLVLDALDKADSGASAPAPIPTP
ncbi:MAG: protein-disulfide reductase DsbD family protein [Alphaproteobacteria bacterium]|nr:protein-disulfide reductase DsbD family protein [Alphaproteobacteria bacterium]